MAATKRPQNKCKSCGYTWYPRGKNLSNKCPNCGSTQVSTVGSWGALVALLFIGFAIFGNHEKPKDEHTSALAPQIETQSTEATQTPSSAPPQVDPEQQQKSELSASDLQPMDSARNVATSEGNVKLTPSSICDQESNLFSRNNCEWKECEKPEFSNLEECANKKQKGNAFEG